MAIVITNTDEYRLSYKVIEDNKVYTIDDILYDDNTHVVHTIVLCAEIGVYPYVLDGDRYRCGNMSFDNKEAHKIFNKHCRVENIVDYNKISSVDPGVVTIQFDDCYKTSDEWASILTEVTVMDPDGWDRKNYDYSWFGEFITMEEYLKRRDFSTCMYKNEK